MTKFITPTFNQYSLTTVAFSHKNEDSVTASPDHLIIADGATALTPSHYMKGYQSDPQWLSQQVVKDVAETHHDTPIDVVLRRTVKKLADEYVAAGGNLGLSTPNMPVTSFGMARRHPENNELLEITILGDVKAYVRNRKNEVTVIENDALEHIDARSIQTMVDIAVRKNITVKKARQFINDVLIEARQSVNQPDGYWVLELKGDGIQHALTVTVPVSDVTEILLTTDGYHVAETIFGLTPSELLNVSRKELSGLPKQILDTYNEDASWDKFPRFKHMDDSSAVYSTFMTPTVQRDKV